MRLVTRIIGGFLVMVALIAGLAAYQLFLVQRLLDANRELARIDVVATRTSLDIRRDLGEIRRLTRVLFVRQDLEYTIRLEARREAIGQAVERLGELDLSAAEVQTLADLDSRWQSYRTLARDAEAISSIPGTRLDRSREPTLLSVLDELATTLDRLDDASRTATSVRLARSAEQADRSRTAARAATAVALLCGIVLALLIARSVAQPLRGLGHGTREMASGNFGFRVPVRGSPELAALAEDFNRMADRLGELEQLKKEFLSNISHDLKAPLASMQEASRLMLDGGSLTEKQERFLRLQLTCGDRLGGMIADLLETARLESGTVHFDLSAQDLKALADQALAEAQSSIEARQIEVDRLLPGQPLTVGVDRSLLLRAMANLLSNAVKFSPVGGRIGVRVQRFDDPSDLDRSFARPPARPPNFPSASFEVWDTGPGIPDEQKARVFERFYRVDSQHRGEQGSGLGLAIARMVVTGHRGDLWVEDSSLGGSRFVMLLPLRGDDS